MDHDYYRTTSPDNSGDYSDDTDRDPTYIPEGLINHFRLFDEEPQEKALYENQVEVAGATEVCNHDQPLETNDDGNAQSNEDVIERSRKRKRGTPVEWKREKMKRLCQSGNAYVNQKGKVVPGRKMKDSGKDCESRCVFKCENAIKKDLRQEINADFWRLTDNEKCNYFLRTTERSPKFRNRDQKNEISRRKFSYKYFFLVNDDRIRVCKKFYLSTLDISERRIYYCYNVKSKGLSGSPVQHARGRHVKKSLPIEAKQFVHQHIASFPTVPSHYCRRESNKQYLERGLNIPKMYRAYLVSCEEENRTPLKLSFYRKVFHTEFNLGFFIPKKDQCETCNIYDKSNETVQQKITSHVAEKESAREEKKKDKENVSPSNLVICFDLQKVLSSPVADISVFYYKRKLAVYNMTAYNVGSKKGYCAVWTEGRCGRGSNEMASALIVLLNKIVEDNPEVNTITLWSDSCVSQNRNSIMTTALLMFMLENPAITYIIQKFQEPGHSCVQEVDSMHSVIERYIKGKELFSPLTIIRCLTQAYTTIPYSIVQLKVQDFKDYKKVAKTTVSYDLSVIPYCSVKQVALDKKNLEIVSYKKSHSINEFQSQQVINKKRTRKGDLGFKFPVTPLYTERKKISELKENDIRDCYKFFCQNDILFWDSLFKENKELCK